MDKNRQNPARILARSKKDANLETLAPALKLAILGVEPLTASAGARSFLIWRSTANVVRVLLPGLAAMLLLVVPLFNSVQLLEDNTFIMNL